MNIFQLIGDKENDITKSIAWALIKCPVFMKKAVYEIFGIKVDPDNVDILYQNYDAATGITDIEMTDRSNNEQKYLLEELKEYLGGIMTMQTKDSNWVYVVVLSGGKPDDTNISICKETVCTYLTNCDIL